ncbi:MAG TPA: hypothetical protein DIC36_01110 [Gammaproteobacteria bacterium]|nr:hypothetical protein [Gammaproteobacteria bacterium]
MFSAFSLGALNHLLGQADWARARLLSFSGRDARLAMPPWQLDFRIRADGFVESTTAGSQPDVMMTLPADTPLRALQGMEKMIEGAHVEGNAQFATELSFVLRRLRWDAEEDLSRVFGDIAAHRIARGAEALAGWQRNAARRLAENFYEYLTEENPALVRAQDMATFGIEVEQLSDDLTNLEQRIAKLAG